MTLRTLMTDCSTCSSWSSSSEYDFDLTPNRAYGGVRIEYVPNDVLALARQRASPTRPQTPSAKDKDKKCMVT